MRRLVIGRSIARQRRAERIAPVERCLLVGRRTRLRTPGGQVRGLAERARSCGAVKATEIVGDHAMLSEIVERDNIHRIIIDTDATTSAATVEIVRARQRDRPAGQPAPEHARRRRRLGRLRRHRRARADGRAALRPQSLLAGPQARVRRRRRRRCARRLRRAADGARRGRDQARLTRPGAVSPDAHRARRGAVPDAQVPQHDRRRRRTQGVAAHAQRGRRPVQDRAPIRASRASGGCCGGPGSTSCRSSSTSWRGA